MKNIFYAITILLIAILLALFSVPLNFIFGYILGWLCECVPYVGQSIIYGIGLILETVHISTIEETRQHLTNNLDIVFGTIAAIAAFFKPYSSSNNKAS